MAEEIITKRLHVSGLTPAITPTDLSQKLGSFGTVTALDGFGQLDGLGQPRKFGYVTIETTKAKLARCMNLLSGVTWKGSKLRMGEAKPDFRERIAREHEPPKLDSEDGEPPRKKRRLPRGVQGVHAKDMTLVTPENATDRGGWRVTPLGRIVRPVRMRPEHPLPEPLSTVASTVKTKSKASPKKKKKKVKEPAVRARKRTIDPTQWGSQHLKGVFLENAGSLVEGTRRTIVSQAAGNSSSAEESSDQGDNNDEYETEDEEVIPAVQQSSIVVEPPSEVPRPVTIPVLATPVGHSTQPPVVSTETDLVQEKIAALGLLQSLFGDREDDWGGSVDSDVEMIAAAEKKRGTVGMAVEQENDFEEVPMEVDAHHKEDSPTADADIDAPAPQEDVATKPVFHPTKSAKLKDLFAPREEEAGFSLLGHLDLDLELDDSLDPSFGQAQAIPVPQPSAPAATALLNTHGQSYVSFDPSRPLFFPLSEDARAGFKGRVKDPLDVAKENGWNWRNFCRTQTPEEIKQRWEEQKVELTKDWKRRHREAMKSRRRRGGGDGE
ncbi:hypothetical protein PHLCEN_2v2343 [Hermanssonia centrifuga]|uniref:RRM domain-containing protein n=1 Tax=Hermanssonia centrifuga TaxID=98765 RepID=A0A2R6RM93_9APHY|nr:hypothetical protein PHLCEN_2v2343 [Hermanssonia centrifuga]